jgi:translation elongation factor EF-Ts
MQGAKARVLRFARLEVGAGIEKKKEDFVAEVKAQAEAQKKKDEENKGGK